ncbi:YdcF family protein [Saccharopolyspora erythraea]|uniref:YdcF family protein n=1 Tax=Saccharopolyspora erythraea TaxID=1836 RepID=UPI001BAC3FB8|nr:YdcF family protein [Saccharopolyspora erythraea]QUH01029.1 YdcF family protein [Saccharopolyspora erythraea]
MVTPGPRIPDEVRGEVELLWEYHDLRHDLRPCDVGVGLGCHDIGVAEQVVDLYHAGYFPLIVFTGANAPTTVERFPRGEAVHYRERAMELGVPDPAIVVEPRATNTGENIEFTRHVLAARGVEVRSLLLVCKPYQQRRAYATAKHIWPGVEIVCGARRLPLDDYVESIGDARRVIDMLVGDTQRITLYAQRGFAAAQHVPREVDAAWRRLVDAGYTSRLVRD